MKVSESDQYEPVTDCSAVSELVCTPTSIQRDPAEE